MFNLAMVDDIDDDSSLHRMARAKDLMPARTMKEALSILGDFGDKDFHSVHHPHGRVQLGGEDGHHLPGQSYARKGACAV